MSSRIAVVILARNEEKSIARALESVLPSASQLIVLDMESTDATGSIAKALGAEVIAVPLRRDFDVARQKALEVVDTDWVFQLDADEWAPGVLQRVVAEGWLRHERPIAFPKLNYLAGRLVTRQRWWPNYQVKLFKRKGASYSSNWHRSLQFEGKPLRLPRQAVYAVHHEGYESPVEMIATATRYLPDPGSAMTLRKQLTSVGRPLAGYLITRGWLDGADGVAILITKILNEVGRQASAKLSSEHASPIQALYRQD